MDNDLEYSHAGKAASYDIGRPDYPDAFFDYFLYELSSVERPVVADIGAGAGKNTKTLLNRGCPVYAVEPDAGMSAVLKIKLNGYADCIITDGRAEHTGIPDGAADIIFCGNSYHWFDRRRTVPEFRRILKNPDGAANVMITTLGPAEANDIPPHKKFSDTQKKPTRAVANHSEPFRGGAYEIKTFVFTVCESFEKYLHGNLSASRSPAPGDARYNEYAAALKSYFDERSRGGVYEAKFILKCIAGSVRDLAL